MSTLTEEPRVPKYLQLLEQIRQQIAEGVLRPGERLPSFQSLRVQRGLTNSTVEKVYGLLERDGLIVRRPGSGTFVAHRPKPTRIHSSGKARKQKFGTIGVSGMGFTFAGSSSYWARMLQGMREAVKREQSQLMLLDHDSLSGWGKTDGVLLCDYVSAEVLENLPPGMPRAFLVSPLPGMAGVCADDYSGGRLATQHLLDLGHRRIAYIHSNDANVVPRRAAGYRDALEAAGITPQARWQRTLISTDQFFRFDYGPDFVNVGHETMNQWLHEDWSKLGCTAILAHNDETAIGINKALNGVGFNVPSDISVVGFDGVEIGAYSSPRLTTIEVPLRQIGVDASEMLIRRIHHEPLEAELTEHKVLPLQLKVRESTAPPSG